MKKLENTGITLIALVITIIILLILAGVTIGTLIGEGGILNKAKTAQKEKEEKTATEIINLKITNIQLQGYQEEEKMPDLQYLADRLYEDNEIQYIYNESQKQANTKKEKIEVTGDTIFTKLNHYPYEFEIDRLLRLASINGIKVSQDSQNKEEMKELKATILQLQKEVHVLKQEKAQTFDYQIGVEKEIGKWYDGSKMYEISLAIEMPITSIDGQEAVNKIDLTDYEVKQLMVHDGFFVNPEGKYLTLPVWPGNADGVGFVRIRYSSFDKKIEVANAWKIYNQCKGYITLRYNKN